MPVSFAVATHPAKPYPFAEGRDGYTAKEALAIACTDQHTKAGEILQFSLPLENDTDGSYVSELTLLLGRGGRLEYSIA
jgi:hypothetical protein